MASHGTEQGARLEQAKLLVAQIRNTWTHLKHSHAAAEIWRLSVAIRENFIAEEANEISHEEFQRETARLNGEYDAVVARPGHKAAETMLHECTGLEQDIEDLLANAEDEALEARKANEPHAAELEQHAEAIEEQFHHAQEANSEVHAALLALPPPTPAQRSSVIAMRAPLPVAGAPRNRFARTHPAVRQQHGRGGGRGGRHPAGESRLRHMHLAEEEEEERALGKGGALGTLSLRQARRYFGRAY
ncbi:hypothetical protein JCM10450v2_008182 [Rhodotorula kratochvilovae]